jgi:hypothetical protein
LILTGVAPLSIAANTSAPTPPKGAPLPRFALPDSPPSRTQHGQKRFLNLSSFEKNFHEGQV